MAHKYDYEPLLAPGRHFMSLAEVQSRFVDAFQDGPRQHRARLFLGLEEMIQRLLLARLPCRVCIDGSFLTKKPLPGDIDAVVCLDGDLEKYLTEQQRELIDQINLYQDFFNVDSSAFFDYPVDHELRGSALSATEASRGYGLEHSEQHLKGYVVLRLYETDVGLRICR